MDTAVYEATSQIGPVLLLATVLEAGLKERMGKRISWESRWAVVLSRIVWSLSVASSVILTVVSLALVKLGSKLQWGSWELLVAGTLFYSGLSVVLLLLVGLFQGTRADWKMCRTGTWKYTTDKPGRDAGKNGPTDAGERPEGRWQYNGNKKLNNVAFSDGVATVTGLPTAQATIKVVGDSSREDNGDAGRWNYERIDRNKGQWEWVQSAHWEVANDSPHSFQKVVCSP